MESSYETPGRHLASVVDDYSSWLNNITILGARQDSGLKPGEYQYVETKLIYF